MRIRVLAFARLREILNAAETALELRAGARVGDAWAALAEGCPALEEHRASTRVACNGRLVAPDHALHDGDEVALLPPVGGG
ncbi:MAG TPA: MoaD/ThiS family protein [Candidatus Binatia bacterium]|nr:MoaD/ThiS family protein [Candidatus Binatia bacterium]